MKRITVIALCVLSILVFLPLSAAADTGPKPSVHVLFENLDDELCYATLLSKSESTGPSSAWDGEDANAIHNENEHYGGATLDYKTWKAFVDYKDSDGYYFLQAGWQIDETKKLAWTYYPPSSFKVLLYYPERGVFLTSEICERYAFDSYYTVNIVNGDKLSISRSYDYSKEFLSLIARIAVTVILEMGVALLFGFRGKKALLVLVGINLATQIVLNTALNIINYNLGYQAFVINYILMELFVFMFEAMLYCICIPRIQICRSVKKPYWYVVYALIANAVSFGAGFLVAKAVPGIF